MTSFACVHLWASVILDAKSKVSPEAMALALNRSKAKASTVTEVDALVSTNKWLQLDLCVYVCMFIYEVDSQSSTSPYGRPQPNRSQEYEITNKNV